ncbi:Anthranilate synthase component 1 [Phycisphaerae bacterium RAS1]|nr:Anthranilate synthase component 1 [Phycisphaerae bacterium RAS1]
MICMSIITPTFSEFRSHAAGHNRVPLVARLIGDDLTPVGAFARLAATSQHAFLLESVVGGEKVARYSFLGADPSVVFQATRQRVAVTDLRQGSASEITAADPLAELEKRMTAYRAAEMPDLPRFVGGAVGYAAYDVVRYGEDLPASPPDDRGLPDLLFGLYESMVVFDHVRKLVLVVVHAAIEEGGDENLRRAYDQAAARVERVIEKLSRPAPLRPVGVSLPVEPLTRYASNFERGRFEQVVDACKEYIRSGDVFQVVISQRLLLETAADPFDIYRALRVINPSPFMFYLKSPQVTLVGASPEIMCRVEEGVVTNRPLAGTRPRGKSEEEDRRLRDELLADPKERAEHIMLVDLGRNDVGRVARPGSVKLAETMSIEYYSHVMHISSTVTGELAEGKTAFDALRATLPVGTVSGAPKVRAMQIIDEFEPTRRGPYAGAIGYIDFAGNMDTCIGLRTLVMQPADGGKHRAYVQVGAGIVADSQPAAEYQETINKAKGLLSAIALAEGQMT